MNSYNNIKGEIKENIILLLKDINNIVYNLINKVIPHFDNYTLKTSKYLNYLDFKSAVIMMSEKKHYSIEGINNLREVKSNMNKFRLFQDKFYYCWSKDITIEPE